MAFKNVGYVECAYSIYLIYLRNVNVFSIAFFRNKVFFFKHDFTKTRVLRYSSHQLCAKCITRCVHAECVYFFDSNC